MGVIGVSFWFGFEWWFGLVMVAIADWLSMMVGSDLCGLVAWVCCAVHFGRFG